jgi:hypothetical protein
VSVMKISCDFIMLYHLQSLLIALNKESLNHNYFIAYILSDLQVRRKAELILVLSATVASIFTIAVLFINLPNPIYAGALISAIAVGGSLYYHSRNQEKQHIV